MKTARPGGEGDENAEIRGRRKGRNSIDISSRHAYRFQ